MVITAALLLSLAGVIAELVFDNVWFSYGALVIAVPCLVVIVWETLSDLQAKRAQETADASAEEDGEAYVDHRQDGISEPEEAENYDHSVASKPSNITDQGPTSQGDPAPANGEVTNEPTTMVKVIPGRRRFHLDGCKLLNGHEHQALTLVEASEEGFTQCSACSNTRNRGEVRQ